MSHRIRRAAGVSIALVLGGAATAVGAAYADATTRTSSSDQVALNHIRRLSNAYRNVDAALADGFLPTEHCTESPDGGMGLHYVNPGRMMAPLDLAKPQILLYQRRGDRLELVGVEWFQPDADQDLTTSDDRPSLYGHAFDGPMPGHEPGMPVHYDLHAWAFKHNPSGAFAPWNPTVHC